LSNPLATRAGRLGDRAGGAVNFMITMPNRLGKHKKKLEGGLVRKKGQIKDERGKSERTTCKWSRS